MTGTPVAGRAAGSGTCFMASFMLFQCGFLEEVHLCCRKILLTLRASSKAKLGTTLWLVCAFPPDTKGCIAHFALCLTG